jgi:hypothetical protein
VRAHGGCRLPGYTASALACLTAFLVSVRARQKVTSSFAHLVKPATQGRALPSDPRRRRAGTWLVLPSRTLDRSFWNLVARPCVREGGSLAKYGVLFRQCFLTFFLCDKLAATESGISGLVLSFFVTNWPLREAVYQAWFFLSL